MKTYSRFGVVIASVLLSGVASAQVLGGGGLTGGLSGSLGGAMNSGGFMGQGAGSGSLGMNTGPLSGRTRDVAGRVSDRSQATRDALREHGESAVTRTKDGAANLAD